MKKTNFSNLFKQKNTLKNKYYTSESKYNITNTQIKNFLKSNDNKIIISKNKSHINFNIKLSNNSLIKIFHKINDKYFYIQDYLKLSFISEKRDIISFESKETYERYIKILNNCNLFTIILKKRSNYRNAKIKISKISLKLLFKYSGIDFAEEVFNYFEIMIYQEITSYHFEEFENLDELLYYISNNNFGKNNFYIFNHKNNNLSPISNYSIKTILKMQNKNNNDKNDDNKYFVFKIKDKNILLLEKKNKNFFDKLILENDYKFIDNRYKSNGGVVNNWKKIEKDYIMSRQKKSNLIEFDNYLLQAEELLNNINNILSKIEKYKTDFNKKISNDNNIFIPIKDINNNTKFINIQYIKLIYRKSIYYKEKNSSFIFDYDLPDYSGANISISLNKEEINNYLSLATSEKNIGILNNDKKYLIKIEFLKNLLKNWKILDKKYKFYIEYPLKEEKELSLNEIIIDEQNKITKIFGKVSKRNENDKLDNKTLKSDYIFLKIKKDEINGRSRNNGNLSVNFALHSDFKERKNSELLNSETSDSNDSEIRLNRSMHILNNSHTLPEKDFYSIHKVVKIIKRDKKRKNKNVKK